ncbi:MAG: hypothetical protein NVS1B13_11900 [Flavisolibacter sp.]
MRSVYIKNDHDLPLRPILSYSDTVAIIKERNNIVITTVKIISKVFSMAVIDCALD